MARRIVEPIGWLESYSPTPPARGAKSKRAGSASPYALAERLLQQLATEGKA
jgi:hypothetical protein